MVHTWAKDYAKLEKRNVEKLHISFRNGCTNKSHLVKLIYNLISKTLLYHRKDPEKAKVFLLGST